MSDDENGGAIAIKGFNYQKASIILVMIQNYEKDNFKVIPESSDDFEIQLEDTTFFVQVKGTSKLSIKNMIRRTKKKSGELIPSIIEKNLAPGNDVDRRKIFLWDLIETTKKELISHDGDLVTPTYSLSENQKEDIEKSLHLNDQQKNRINNQYIYITPFTNNLETALIMLKGIMVDKNLLVTNERAKIVLGELSLEIDQKSEISMTNEEDKERKTIKGDYLKQIFLSVKQKEFFDEVLDKLSYNSLFKLKIKRQKLCIPLLYKGLKETIKQKADLNSIMDKTDEQAIQYFEALLSEEQELENRELSIALAIDCFCELGELYL